MYLQCAPIRTNDSLPPFHKSLLIPHQVTNLDDVTRHVVFQYLDRLAGCYTSCEKFDHIASFKDDVGIECLASGANGHGTMDKVESASDALCLY